MYFAAFITVMTGMRVVGYTTEWQNFADWLTNP